MHVDKGERIWVCVVSLLGECMVMLCFANYYLRLKGFIEGRGMEALIIKVRSQVYGKKIASVVVLMAVELGNGV